MADGGGGNVAVFDAFDAGTIALLLLFSHICIAVDVLLYVRL